MKKTITYVIVIILLIAGGWIIKNATSENSDVAKDFPFESIETIPSTGTINQLYQSKSFQMDISYPENWQVAAYEDTEPKHISFSSYDPSSDNLNNEIIKNEAIIEFHLFNYDETNLENWINKFHSNEPLPTTNSVKATKQIEIDGQNSIIQLVNTQGEYYYYVFIQKGNKIIFIRGTETNNPYESKFLEMLKLLKFN